jgi:hypothetical protein
MLHKRLGLSPGGASGFLIAASIALGLSAGENWLLRAFATALLLLGGVTILVSMILSRKFGFIGTKLVDKSLKLRLVVEILGRLVFLALLIFVAPILFYMCLDFYGLIKRGYPTKTEAIVTYVPGCAIWNWVWKDVGLQTQDGKTGRYNLFFYPPYPNQGERYAVLILPKSKCVLSMKLLPQ